MKTVKLSDRLRAVSEMVSEGKRVADIGTDHAYIPIFLLQNKIAVSAIAMDVNQGPLIRAQEHILECGWQDKIETRLSNGLRMYEKGEADCMILSGMGGPLIASILKEGMEKFEGTEEFIFQPQSEIGKFREFLFRNHFQITAENMIFEDGKYYSIMKAVIGEMKEWTPVEFSYGKYLIEQKNTVLFRFIEKELKQKNRILEELSKQRSDSTALRSKEIHAEIERLLECKRRMC